ncbi:uncharacterized protein LOC129244755 [Anastrepha obliqua]|uniref:uncharacterized protein LOC129244755 n=1 Tax=Anastrepha obliqua TaxID=95512 RepID=UPI0023B18894|nr:uncharacterized protein LOC128866987 isoform X2 [Anastrepha ludens]XP_054738544.1 uncharacterized protein LOC129244755 [Anastrepha obliqua]
MLKTFTNFEFALLVSVLPAACFYLWTLIAGDLINFSGSRVKVLNYAAKDMVNCYQNYAAVTNGDVKKEH